VIEPRPSRGKASIRVLLVDDHPVLRGGLRSLIDAQRDLRVVGEAADGVTAIESVAALKPDVVVMDLAMPHLGGVTATEWIKANCPGVQVLALTGYPQRAYVNLMFAAGAAGFCQKQSAPRDLLRAIRTIAAGGIYLDSAFAAREAGVC
jgi:DNA-binding NarL/FixJ family response regulator